MLDRTVDASADARWSCNRKKAYPTSAMAESVAARIRVKEPAVVAYACTHCGRYHIGHARDVA